ncbi:ABC transporter ATP-binding protein [Streptacidiphilus albus]|uniref:ABC transporter ATP-binding protein n=1 Tax=Streptacidiphilus albus TaxID=105425 RepID=UPI00054C2DEA|nr:ABC transporter ATP-binding protein [Streptacidiphilus albus]
MTSPSSSPEAALTARGLTGRHRRRGPDVLADATFQLPAGVICALVGPNGSGKSTLLELAAGVQRPSAGTVEVFGQPARTGHPRVAYLPQDRPLFRRFTVAETLCFAARANRGNWDAGMAQQVADISRFDRRDQVRDLSGGERTRVALAVALGKRADLLLLDEPMADLDVLARQELMGLLMAHVADTGCTVVMSSHIIAELADACDHLLVLHEGRVRLCGEIEELTDAHAVVTLPGGTGQLAGHVVVESRPAGRGTTALIRPAAVLPAAWQAERPSLEELVLAHLGTPTAPALALPADPRHQDTAA